MTELISTSELAQLLSLTSGRIRQLTLSGVLSAVKGAGRGNLYNPVIAIQQYVEFRVESAVETPELTALQKARAAKLAVETEKMCFDLELRRHKVIPSGHVLKFIAETGAINQAAWYAMPRQCSVPVLGKTDVNEVHEILLDYAEASMRQIAEVFKVEEAPTEVTEDDPLVRPLPAEAEKRL